MTKFLLLAASALSIAAAPATDRLLPAKDASAIYAPVALPGTPDAEAIARAGYVQEEYLISGTGNIYDLGADGRAVVKTPEVDYTTRMIVVRPRDAKRFSGVVQMGFSHPSFASNQWGRIGPYVLRSGDMYALIVVGADAQMRARSTAAAPAAAPLMLPWFDAKRYADFRWPDDGVRWDVIGQTAVRLREGSLPGALKAFRAKQLYVSGWSYLGSIQRSYINYGFHDRYRLADGGPAVDGYVIGISSNSVNAGFGPINTTSGDPPADQRGLRTIDVPVIELMSENEARTNTLPQNPDTDAYKGGHRLYEVGGVSHQDSGLPATTTPWETQLIARGNTAWTPVFDCRTPATDVPMRDLAQAALANLKLWHDRGIAPPKAGRLVNDGSGKAIARDALGNPKGGVRVVQLDLPLARYDAPPASDCTGVARFQVLRRIPLDAAVVRATYPAGKADYLRRVRARFDTLVAERWLLKPDADAQYARIAGFAEGAFR